MSQKPLAEFSDEELNITLEHKVQNVQYCAQNYLDEIARRSQDKHTRTLNKLTFVIAVATLLNTITAIVLAVLNYIR